MRILIVGLASAQSGLSNVMYRLARELAVEHDVSLLGFTPGGDRPPLDDLGQFDMAVEPCRAGRFGMRNGALRTLLDRRRPDCVLVNGPGFMVEPLLEQLGRTERRSGFAILLYLPIEGRPTQPGLLDIIARADSCVLYCPSALHDIAAMADARRQLDPDFRCPPLAAIGHGVDLAIFKPTAARTVETARLATRQSFWTANDPDEIVTLNVCRPYDRKRLDLSIAGFGLALARHPRLRLVLHPGAIGSPQTATIAAWIENAGAVDSVTVIAPEAMSTTRLNDLYNACDIGLSTAMGEGWGLPVFEHAATGAAQIVPDHTSLRDNWSGAAILLPTPDDVPIFYEYSTMRATTPEHVGDAISLLTDPRVRAGWAEKALTRANCHRFRWGAVGAEFRMHDSLNPLPRLC